MINQIGSIIFMTVAGTVQGIALEYMLDTNDERTSKIFRIIYWTILAFIPSCINVMGSDLLNTLGLRQLLHWGMAIIAMLLFYTDPIWRRLIAIFLVYLGMTCADLMFPLTTTITGLDISFFLDKSNPIVMLFVSVGMSISITCIFLIAFVWKKFVYKTDKISYTYFFIIYMLNHFITFMIMEMQLWKFDLQEQELVPAVTGFICEAVLLILVFSQSEKETLETELRREKRRVELEKVHFQEVKRRREELFNLSESSYQEILNIQSILVDNQSKQAEEHLVELLKRVENTREYPYCDVPIINAILSEKSKLCEEYNIQLDVDIRITEESGIQQFDLCCVFANLMDNAIRACKKITARGENAKISLHAVRNGCYMVIRCSNTADEVIQDRPEGTGLGLGILRDIASRYDGKLITEYNDNIYDSKIVLKM